MALQPVALTPGIGRELVPRSSNIQMEKCLIGRQVIELPGPMTEDLSMFMSVMSVETWSQVLTDSQRKHLLKFLPSFPDRDKSEKSETLRRIFKGDNFMFGSPLKQFHKKLKSGQFSPDIAKYIELCRRAKHREYRHQQRVHYSNLLKEVLINRQRILQAATLVSPDEPIKFEHFHLKTNTAPPKCIENRVKRRCTRMLKDVNKECEVEDSSSSEDDDLESSTVIRNRRQLLKVLRPGSPDNVGSGVLGTFDPPPPPTSVNGVGGSSVAPPPKRPLSPVELTEYDLTEMLKTYKRRRHKEPHHPELFIAGLSVDDIITRVQAAKKVNKVVQRKRARDRPPKKLPPKVKVTSDMSTNQEDDEVDVSGMFSASVEDASDRTTPNVKEECDSEDWAQADSPPQNTTPAVEMLPHKSNFFSLLRDVIYEDPDQRVTTQRVEERVREWQEMSAASENAWFQEQPNWVDLVATALQFLSGDVLGLTLENFVPYLDYKERAQHWKWIGQDRDSDADMECLYRHWLLHKDELPIDTHIDPSCSPPPPRSRTEYTVRVTTDEEKVIFRQQERERFANPHRAFTYRLHGYEAVVGPVKGVYHKESAMNKAREHTILMNERPAYVTILTLVRDSAARLPNGEGTRSDICELLKDSQFLAPGVPDAQINTVVSGALDRLHYEKDPCVKYDVNRKLWIYLHRNRTQAEFERIHLAQGAAVKAKKALQKPKIIKKKDGTIVQTISMVVPGVSTVTTSTISRQSSILSTGSNDSFVNVETLSPLPLGQSPLTSIPVVKVPVTPSSPQTPSQSPRVTPQHSPKIVMSAPRLQSGAQLQTHNKILVSGTAQLPMSGKLLASGATQLPTTSKLLVSGATQLPTASKLLASSLRQVPIQQGSHIAHIPRGVTVTRLPMAGGKVTPSVSSVTSSRITEQIVSPAASTAVITVPSTVLPGQHIRPVSTPGVVAGQPMTSQAGLRPVTLSLLQDGTRVESVSMITGQTGKPRTVLLQTQAGKAPRILTQQALRAGLGPGMQVAGSPLRLSTTTSQLVAPQQNTMLAPQSIHLQTHTATTGSSTQTVAAALAKAGVLPIGGTAIAKAGVVQTSGTALTKAGLVSVGGAGKPILTRMVGGQPQVVNLSSLWASQAGLQQKPTDSKQTVKIQGGVVQTGVLQTQPTAVATVINQGTMAANTQGIAQVSMPTKLQQVTVTRGGKPTTMVINKQTMPTTPRVSAATTQTVAQIIQSGALAGKSAMLGGKPIIIGGKSTILGGKPLQIGGKPVQLIGKAGQITAGQITAGQLGLVHSPGVMSAVNVVTQAGGITTQAGNMVTQATTLVTQAVTMVTSTKPGNQVMSPLVTMATKPSSQSTSSMVSQLLQSAQQHNQGKTTQLITLPQGTDGQLKVAGHIQGQQVKFGAGQQQVMAVSGSGHKVVTLAQGVGGLTQIQHIAGAKSVVGPGGKNMMIPAGGVVQGSQLLVQQQPNIHSATKVLTQQQLLSAGGSLRPTLISAGGAKGLQNFQLVKTVISQPGGKPGQTTILLAQPPSQTVTMASDTKVTQVAAKSKAPPIYARIITPPPRVRLAAVRPGQVLTGAQMAPVQGLNMVQTVGQQAVAQQHALGQHTIAQHTLGQNSLGQVHQIVGQQGQQVQQVQQIVGQQHGQQVRHIIGQPGQQVQHIIGQQGQQVQQLIGQQGQQVQQIIGQQGQQVQQIIGQQGQQVQQIIGQQTISQHLLGQAVTTSQDGAGQGHVIIEQASANGGQEGGVS